MAKLFDSLEQEHIDFINAQKLFFTGTNSGSKGVNISPKGIEPLKILGPNSIAYIDFIGSGNRMAEDLMEGSPVTIMFCSFDEKPLILRLYCNGKTIKNGEPGFDDKISLWNRKPDKNIRQVFIFDITKVMTSCGWGVPLFKYNGERSESRKLTG
ncbi:MAG: pyridoxamine 5'-phosphate oxidase family protein [Nitrospinota bacterium]|nr:pyridoxamine 5'-phosphate oxidase family protein [Nitrospinota bacterium]